MTDSISVNKYWMAVGWGKPSYELFAMYRSPSSVTNRKRAEKLSVWLILRITIKIDQTLQEKGIKYSIIFLLLVLWWFLKESSTVLGLLQTQKEEMCASPRHRARL